MLKKILATVVLFALLVPALCLGQKMPPEVKTFTIRFCEEMAAAQRTLSASVNAAATAEKIAAAMNAYNDAIEPIINDQVALEVKYPEFYASVQRMEDDVSSGDAEVDAAQKKFESSQIAFEETAMAKIMKNYTHPAVNAAMMRMQQIMGRMGTGEEDEGEEYNEDF